MAGVCQHCGEVVRTLRECPVCAARVCAECLQDYGCQICHGRATMAEASPDESEEETF
ncbi:MAG: hypothetical protein HYS81_05230 [Candidatus Aenigmatarchaeota archaeon]|nr:MAG: hypothetical protein HYS81_05230 [Candidatus Aenigmarchaeota archaeon]